MNRLKGLILSLLFSISAIAQEKDISHSVEFMPQTSVALFTANEKLAGTAFGGELIYHYNTERNQMPWIRILNVKSVDVIFNYKNMNKVRLLNSVNPYQFGDSYSLLAGLNISLLKSKRTDFNLSPAFGLGYIGETYFTNENQLIGSHVNFTSRIGLKVSTRISSTAKLSAGIDILHYSNAGARVPNNGMNLSNVGLGIIKSISSSNNKVPDSNSWASKHHYKTHSFDLGISTGRRGYYKSKDGYFYKSALYAGYNYRVNPLIGLSAGLDAVYYHSVFDPQNFNTTYQSNATSYDRWRIGAAIGPDIWMNRLALTAKYGYYLKYNSYKPINTYWTAGLKYNLLDWLAVQSKIYVHQTEADFAAFGLIFTM